MFNPLRDDSVDSTLSQNKSKRRVENVSGCRKMLTEQTKMQEFATNVLGVGEIIIVICLLGVNYIAWKRRFEFAGGIHALLIYTTQVQDWLKDPSIESDGNHSVRMQKCEIVMWVCSAMFYPIGFLVLKTCMHPMEPTHVIMREWLESFEIFAIVFLFHATDPNRR